MCISHKEEPHRIFVSVGQSCLFQGNNEKLSVGMGNGSVLSFSIHSSLLGWNASVYCCSTSSPKWGLSLWERFSLFFLEVISHSSLLGWNASVYCCSASCPKGGLGLWERFRLFFFDIISHSSPLIWNASVYWSMFENNLYIASANVTWSYIMQEEYRLTFLILSKWIICFGGHHWGFISDHSSFIIHHS